MRGNIGGIRFKTVLDANLKKNIKPCLWGYPDAEIAQSGKYAIMGSTLEMPSAKWACVRCKYKIYYPPDCLERDW